MSAADKPVVHAEISAEDLAELVRETKELRETLQQRYVTRQRYTRQFWGTVAAITVAILLLAFGLWRYTELGHDHRVQICQTQQQDRYALREVVNQAVHASPRGPSPAGLAFEAKIEAELPLARCQ